MMQFKEGIGWKACYDDERNLYTVKTSWRGDYDLYEIIGPSTAMVIDDRYAELCPWANLPASEKTMSKELTDIAVDLWENEATREQRKKQKEK